ncbi:MAG TPA: hypothetical protein VJT31_24695 [Rugosimonospora sp.]|nr:hypothetical protein [Rugosimonospora sp.]
MSGTDFFLGVSWVPPMMAVVRRSPSITRLARRTRLRIAETWPWAAQLTTAFTRLAALPRPIS